MGIKRNTGRYFIILASVGLLAFTGCKGEKKAEDAQQAAAPAAPGQQQGEVPEGHPPMDQTADNITKAAHSTIKTQKEIVISEEVKAKWKEVKLEITDNSTKQKEVVSVKVGSTTPLTKDGFKLKTEVFVPDYAIAENRIQSRSNEPKNPAVLVELISGDKSVSRGWIFKEFPEFNSYADERFQLILLAPSAGAKN